jgi:biopolymer transport protein ExbB
MMKHSYILPVLLCIVQLVAAKKHDHAVYESLRAELLNVKATCEAEDARLRRVTDGRWTRRQRQVEHKAQLQWTIEKTEADIERLYGEIARVREEMLLRESNAITAKTDLEQAREQYRGTATIIEGLLRKEEDAARAGFPLGQQQRSLRIQELMRDVRDNPQQLTRHCALLQQYAIENLRRQTSCAIGRETILCADNTMIEAPVIRLGTVVAFGINDTGAAWYLAYTANGSATPFEWVRLTDEHAAKHLASSMPQWLKAGAVDGKLFVDVLQNSRSGDLLGVERKTPGTVIRNFIRAGGIVMMPLGLICLWALILLVNRLVVYSMAHSRDDRFIDEAVEFLNQKRLPDAQSFAGRSRGVLARILGTCLKNSKWRRPVAEKAVRELLLAEVPALDKHLDTLAVLAAAAPLLGLLGTVTGMIRMFESITRFGTGDPKLLAGGISEALVTTEAGLAIAIPVLLIHNFLRNRRNHIQADMEMYAMRILNRLWPEE